MVLSTVTVRYTIKNDSGFLVDMSRVFSNHVEAVNFIKELKRIKLVGKAIMELGEQK